jgi:hypothetical protein
VSLLSDAGRVPALQVPQDSLACERNELVQFELEREPVLMPGGSWSAGAPPAPASASELCGLRCAQRIRIYESSSWYA